MTKGTGPAPRASKAAARVRSVITKKKHQPVAAGVAAARAPGRVKASPAAATPTPAAPALSRAIRNLEADEATEKLIDAWHDTHVDQAIAKFNNGLARSAVVGLFDQLDADIIRSSKHGAIARQHRKGEVDYKALAIELLGEAQVEKHAEQFRKPGSNPVTAPNGWSAEAGLAHN